MASSVPEQALLVVFCAQGGGGARGQGTLHLDPSSAEERRLWLELVQKRCMYILYGPSTFGSGPIKHPMLTERVLPSFPDIPQALTNPFVQ